jgi:predicted nucleotidyltransferase
MGGKVNPALKPFLDDFVDELTVAFPDGIESIVIAGSACRPDFVLGKSDVDLGVRARSKDDADGIEEAAAEIYWKLDKKHGLKLRELYAKKQDGKPLPPNPVRVLAQGRRRKDLFSRLNFIHGLDRTLRRHTRISGKALYGPEIPPFREEDGPYHTLFSYDFFLSLWCCPLFLLSPDRAFNTSLKAVLFALEDELYDDRVKDSPAIAAMYAKNDFDRTRHEWSYARKAAYCFTAPLLVFRKNIDRLLKSMKREST